MPRFSNPVAAVVLLLAPLAACSTGSSRTPVASSSGKVVVAAAEDFWGSIAKELGGLRVEVTSLIANPATDPHDYEPTPGDGRVIASARLVITNGLGYDPWTDKLLSANPTSGRRVLKVGDLVGLNKGDNPHQWYSPEAVEKVIAAITSGYKKIDSTGASYFDQRRTSFETGALGPYKSTVADIKAKYSGTPVGASESIFTPMAEALTLRLLTPQTFLDAISEGTDPSAADKATVDRQIATRAIKVFVFNSQNATPDVRRLVDAARANGTQVTTVTETLTPQGSTFEDWQTTQLRALEAALAAATGK
jgi:zinc/manganese transport system substrate-binding protein